MFVILPIGHEKDTVRRLPWVTFSILAICLVVHLFVYFGQRRDNTELQESAREFIEYYFEHPYLEFNEETREILFRGANEEQIEQLLAYYSQTVNRPGASVVEEEQETLDNLASKFLGVINDSPFRKYGFIPADQRPETLFTYMFVHGGWLHLLGNLLFLYLMGPFVEDLWGRPIYAAFYLLVGMLSALLYAQHYPDFTGPLIGASGAIAGVMGAFLIKYWKIKLNFFYFIIPFFRGTFQAPAWLMLPLWVLLELFNARIMDSLSSDGGGVAHWAHVWGFVLGMGFAFALTATKFEEKYIKPKVEAKLHTVDRLLDVVSQAIRQKNLGMIHEGYALLLEEARSNAWRKDVLETLWEFGKEMGDPSEAAAEFKKLIEKEIRQDELSSAVDHFKDLQQNFPGSSLSPLYQYSLIKRLIEEQDFELARQYTEELLNTVDDATPPLVLQNLAGIAINLGSSLAGRVIQLCLRHPEVPDETKDSLRQELTALNPTGG
jgi:membrane associated rhomboid family serine protease